MANIIFTLGGYDFTFSKGRSYPVDDPAEVSVITDHSEGMQMYAYDKGIELKFFNLFFEKLDSTDNSNVETWLTDRAIGPKNTFTYADEDGNNHTVRLLNVSNPLKEISHNNYAGTIRLRKEI